MLSVPIVFAVGGLLFVGGLVLIIKARAFDLIVKRRVSKPTLANRFNPFRQQVLSDSYLVTVYFSASIAILMGLILLIAAFKRIR